MTEKLPDPVAAFYASLQAGPWLEHAACKGMDTSIFFPQRGQSCEPARAVCRRCPVTAECLTYCELMPHRDTSGVWAGLSQRDRRARRARDPLLADIRPNGTVPFEDRYPDVAEDAYRRHAAGESFRSIGESIGVHKNTLAKMIQRMRRERGDTGEVAA